MWRTSFKVPAEAGRTNLLADSLHADRLAAPTGLLANGSDSDRPAAEITVPRVTLIDHAVRRLGSLHVRFPFRRAALIPAATARFWHCRYEAFRPVPNFPDSLQRSLNSRILDEAFRPSGNRQSLVFPRNPLRFPPLRLPSSIAFRACSRCFMACFMRPESALISAASRKTSESRRPRFACLSSSIPGLVGMSHIKSESLAPPFLVTEAHLEASRVSIFNLRLTSYLFTFTLSREIFTGCKLHL